MAGLLDPCRRDHGHHQPVGQLVQAAGVRLRCSDLDLLGPEQPVGIGAGAAGQEGQVIERPGRIPLARRAPPTRTWRLSVVLAAGLAGIQNGYELPPEVVDNVHELTPAERQAAGIARLPETMAEALELMERSELVAEALGEHVFSWFLRNKRKEWDRYQHHVSRFELDTYLPVL